MQPTAHDPNRSWAVWRNCAPPAAARLASGVYRLIEDAVPPLTSVTALLFDTEARAWAADLARRHSEMFEVLHPDPLVLGVIGEARDLGSSRMEIIRPLAGRAVGVARMAAAARRPRGQTGIEWADVTWNPVAGCAIHSAGCTNCYAMSAAHGNEGKAMALVERGRHPAGMAKYVGLTKLASNGRAVWKGDVGIGQDHEWEAPLSWRTPRHIFVNSMSDLFYEGFSDEVRERLFRVVADGRARHHRFLLLTKRPEGAAAYFARHPQFAALANLWLGVTVEDMAAAARIDVLRSIPVQQRWLSVEPLLSALPPLNLRGISWVITGGESGPRSRIRKCDAAWVREVRDACAMQGVAFFHKQWGSPSSNPLVAEDGMDEREAKEIDDFGMGGALLDGCLHRDRPAG